MICRMCGKPKPGHMFWEGEDQHFRVCRDCRSNLSTALHQVATSVETHVVPAMQVRVGSNGDNFRILRASGIAGGVAFVLAQLPSPPENRERVHASGR
jgi:hypothetical protein